MTEKYAPSSLEKESPLINIFEGIEISEIIDSLQKMQTDYKQEYNPIPYEGKGNDPNYFFLSLQAYQEIINRIPEVRTMILTAIGKLDDAQIIQKWKQGIESILFKALVAESVKYSQWIAEYISQETIEKPHVKILELCTGAGITTTMLYLERLNRSNDAKTQIVSVDNSIESVACAILIASSFGIPCQICRPVSLSSIDSNYNGIIFVIGEVEKFIENMGENEQYNAVVSDNGISYFPQSVHNNILETVKRKLGAVPIYLSSLENGKSVKLKLPFEIKGVFQGEKFRTRPEEEYIEENGIISETYTRESKAFFVLANKMLKNGLKGIKDLKMFLDILSNVTRTSQDLNKEMTTPVSKAIKDIETGNLAGFKISETFPNNPKAPCQAVILK